MLWKIFFVGVISLFSIQTSDACTGIVRKADNGDIVYARTMEFGSDQVSFDLAYIPRDIDYTAQTPSGQPGLKWKTKLAHTGFCPFGMPLLADGLNEKGLGCGAFYFPGWAEYEVVSSSEASQTISNIDLVSWILGNFEKVADVRLALKNIKVAGVKLKAWGFVPPLHYIVVDSSGDKLVIEFIKGKLVTYDTPIGVITNSPSYDWHLTNMRNYIGLQALNRPSIKINGAEFSQFGQGTGAIGLPGNFTPPARFIRAAFFSATVYPGKTGIEEIGRTFKILNQFDIPKGSVRELHDGKEISEVTQWTSASDLNGRRYYFHTEFNRTVRFVDLNVMDKNAKKAHIIHVQEPEVYQEISSSLK